MLATQTLITRRPRTLQITVDGALGDGVFAKDVILAVIGEIGVAGGNGHVIEYAGTTIAALSMEGRMTVCNMSVEAGARAGMVAPDEKTLAYLHGRPHAPRGDGWNAACAAWTQLRSDEGAAFDQHVTLDVSRLGPQVTWGTTPEDVIAIDGAVPDPRDAGDDEARARAERSLAYMGLTPGTQLADVRSITSSSARAPTRASRICAPPPRGRGRTRASPPACTRSSCPARAGEGQAEAEGLDRVFRQAGFSTGARPAARCASA